MTEADTRRVIVRRLVDRGVTKFAMRPLDGPEELRQEVVVLSADEAYHELPCCDDVLRTEYVVLYSVGVTNVRTVASADDPKTVHHQLQPGDSVTVESANILAGGVVWHKTDNGYFVAERLEDGLKVFLRPR